MSTYVGPSQIQEIFTKLGKTPDVATYTPVFLDRVKVISPDGTFQPVSEMYCLSIPSALELAYLLLDQQPTLYLGQPTPFSYGSPFYYTENVPWGSFYNQAQRNMGTLAYYFRGNNGPQGGPIALSYCKQDIAFG